MENGFLNLISQWIFMLKLTKDYESVNYRSRIVEAERNILLGFKYLKEEVTVRKWSFSYVICFLVLFFGLSGCATSNTNDNEKVNDKPKITNESKTVADFKVTINVQKSHKDPKVYATITYIGVEAEKDIYHGGSIFFFTIDQQDGDFEYVETMTLPLITTTLVKNKPLRVDFNGIKRIELLAGTYKFEAIANFALDSDKVTESKIEIPVYKIYKID